jgi:hypothetical protein
VRQLYHLKITLADVRPQVWRRVVMPGGFTLDRLHRVIQLAMGWHDAHLHSFDVNGVPYGRPDPDGLLETRDELDARLDAVAGKGTRFTYTYDFGDWWEHDIVVEDVLVAEPDDEYPVCTDGAGAGLPEDVGGAYGYERFRTALDDPEHKDHEAMVEWNAGRTPAAFDPERISVLMRRMA